MKNKNSNKITVKQSSIDFFKENYLYLKPYKGNNKVQLHPKMDYYESRNRQRKNRNRNRNNQRRQDLRTKKICNQQGKSCRIGKQKVTHQLKLDQGKRELPEVWSLISMVSNPEKNKRISGNKTFHHNKQLEQRAKIILSREGAINWINKGLFTVHSQSGVGRYKVFWNGNKWICNCPDFTKRNKDCKHILAVQYYLLGYVTIHGEELKESSKIYSQDWLSYDQS
jgi:hypothetical protein